MVLATGQITLTDLNDVRQYLLYLNGNYKTQVYDPNSKIYNPAFPTSNVVITPELYVSGGDGSNLLPSVPVKSVKWYEGNQTITALTEGSGTTGNGLSYTIPTGAVATVAKTLTIKSNLPSNSQVYTAVVVYTDPQTGYDVTIKAAFEIVKVTNGTAGADAINALTAVLTNESHGIPTDSAGGNAVYTGSGTGIRVFEGSTELDYDGVGTGNGKWNVTAAGSAITPSTTKTDATNGMTFGNHSAITADNATITYTITGKRADGTAFSLTKVQTFNKIKAGANGTSPTLYDMILSTSAIKKNISNVFTPSNIQMTGKSQVGSGALQDFSATYKIYTTTGVINNTTAWGTATELSGLNVTYPASGTFATNITGIKVEMYNGGTKLDEQIIPVVADGATGNAGADAYFLNLWAPNGDTIRNSNGTIQLQADMYKGSGKVTPTAYKWYIQNPAATTASKGDADGGDGWELLTGSNEGITPVNTATITVPASAIAGVEGFKVVATAPSVGTKYSGVIVVRDFQDPISVEVVGANIFKNGEGSITLTAQMIQAGSVIPNTGYKFTWALYTAAGQLIKTYSGVVGPTITVPATDVTGTANLVVDVDKV